MKSEMITMMTIIMAITAIENPFRKAKIFITKTIVITP